MKIVLSVHPNKTINGSTAYAYEYFSMLKPFLSCQNSVEHELIIYCEETQKPVILEMLSKYTNFTQMKKSIVFLYKRIDVLKTLNKKLQSVVFVDWYTFNMFKSTTSKKFFYCNRYFEKHYNELSLFVKNSTEFYGYYPYQFSTNGKVKLCINFLIHPKIDVSNNKYTYIYLTNPNVNHETVDMYIKKLKNHGLLSEVDEYIVKQPNQNIKNLYSNISRIIYFQNSDIIDKNNRTMLEAEFYGIVCNYYDDCGIMSSNDNIRRIKSRNVTDFTLYEDNKMIKDIIEYEKTME